MKKIIFLLPDLSYGGAQRTIVNIANYLSKIPGYNITIIIINNKKKVLLLNKNIDLINLNSKKLSFAIVKFYKYIKHIRPNLVLSTTVHLNLLNILIKIFLLKSKTKIIIRESNPTFYRNDINYFLKYLCRIIYPHADKIISLSEFVTSELSSNINDIEKKIETISNPIEINLIKNESQKLVKSDYYFEKSLFYICFCGRITYQKNIELLINIIKNIKIPNIKILVIGDGPEKVQAINLIKKEGEGFASKFIFLGYQKNPYYFIKKSNLFILTSRWEGFGHVIVESLICDTPVVCFNTKGLTKNFVNNKEVFYYNSNDINYLSTKLEYLIQNYENIFQNFNSYEIYKQYDVKIISNIYKKSIDSLLI